MSESSNYSVQEQAVDRIAVKKVRNYQKVPDHLKQELLKLVIQQGVKINQAAQQLELKYATAKTIVFTYRAQNKPKKNKNKSKKRKCLVKVDFVPIDQSNAKSVNVEISIGGNIVQQFTDE